MSIKMDSETNCYSFSVQERKKLLDETKSREIEECNSRDSLTSEILQALGINYENLPTKCKNLLQETANLQKEMHLQKFDSVTLSLYNSEKQLESMKQDYEILKLQQKNEELETVVKHNREALDNLKNQLSQAKLTLNGQKLSPDQILEEINVLKQKFYSYDKTYQKHKANFEALGLESHLKPESLTSLIQQLAELKSQELSLKQRAEDVTLAKEAAKLMLPRNKT